MSLPPDITKNIDKLREALLALPEKHHPSGFVYTFVVDQEYVEHPGSIQGSINHSLEVEFGSRASGKPIEFKSHGSDLVAVVDVLASGITGHQGENPILLKWISDLHAATQHAYILAQPIDVDAGQVEDTDRSKRVRKHTSKRELLVREAEEKSAAKKQKVAAKEHTQKAKTRTEGKFNFNPEDLREIDVIPSKRGRKPGPLLNKLTILCEVQSDTNNDDGRQAPGSERAVAPTVRYRDLSDIFKRFGEPVTPEDDNDEDAQRPITGADVANKLEELEDTWEEDAGLDESIEQPPPRYVNGFEVADADCVNLDEPLLLDLLSDKPIAGALTRGETSVESSNKIITSAQGASSGSLVAQPFEF